MNHKLFVILLIVLMFLQACHEEFVLDSIKNEKLLVVDGMISNEPGPYLIRVSESSLVNEPLFIPLSGCVVTLYNNAGYSEVLTESDPGVYSTLTEGIQGIVGNRYSLSIKTAGGKEYKSDFQEMKEPIEIDSVYAKIDYLSSPSNPFGIPGYQFYVDTKKGESLENYFLWTMSESFEYDITYEIAYIEDRYNNQIYNNPKYDTLKTCWTTNGVKYFFTGETTNLSIPKINEKPLHFVSTETKKLTKKYSLLVRQYVIDKESFAYWENIENQISDENFLTTTQPFNIRGNLRNINDEKEIVLGYFTVAAVSKKRIFVDRPRVPFYYPRCFVITDRMAIDDYKRGHPAPYFFVEIEVGVYGLIYPVCIDCRSEGGELNKPDFWIDF